MSYKNKYANWGIGRKKEYFTKRLDILRPLLNSKRSPNVMRSVQAEIKDLEIEISKLNARIREEPHSLWRPNKLRKGNDWICNCGEFNVYENLVCWASKPELEQEPDKIGRPKKELTDEQKEHFKSIKPQSERLTSPGLGDIEEFFSFLD